MKVISAPIGCDLRSNTPEMVSPQGPHDHSTTLQVKALRVISEPSNNRISVFLPTCADSHLAFDTCTNRVTRVAGFFELFTGYWIPFAYVNTLIILGESPRSTTFEFILSYLRLNRR